MLQKLRYYIIVLVTVLCAIPFIGQANSGSNAEVSALANQAPNLNRHIIKLALKAYNKARQQGYDKQKILTVIDYTLPSSKRRMWVFNLNGNQVLYHTLVAQGRNTGLLYAKHFSNARHSKESSLGLFLTGKAYVGSDGYSMRLHGLEPGFNNNAYHRDIVMHGAWYVSPQFVKSHGYAGRSWGCTAVNKKLAKAIINTVKNGTLIFSYYPSAKWLNNSTYLS